MNAYNHLKELNACPKALKWVKQYPDKTLKELWNICKRPEWMIWLLANINNENEIISLLYNIVKKYALPYVPEKENIFKETIETIKLFLEDKATKQDCYNVYKNISYIGYNNNIVIIYAIYAITAAVAYTIYNDANTAANVYNAANTAANAVNAAVNATVNATNDVPISTIREEMCDYIRNNVTLQLQTNKK